MKKNAEAIPLYEGTFSVGANEEFDKISKDENPYKGALKLSINPFLIKERDRNILFDTGIGDLFGEDTSIDTIHQNLSKQSLSEYDISHIFISHLHFDHLGGLANRKNGFWELTFPDAEVWISKEGWERLQNNIEHHREDEVEFFHFIDSKAELNFLSENEKPIPNIRIERIGGHTKFHQVLFYENGDDKYLMAGDVIGSRGAINRKYKAKYDEDPEQSIQKREELQKLAYEQEYTIMAYHETDSPLFKLVSYDEAKGYSIKRISE